MNELKVKGGIQIDTLYKNQWSFGICISHQEEETYLFINLFKWSISIGKLLYDPFEDENKYDT